MQKASTSGKSPSLALASTLSLTPLELSIDKAIGTPLTQKTVNKIGEEKKRRESPTKLNKVQLDTTLTA
jgi:hypothetical protein